MPPSRRLSCLRRPHRGGALAPILLLACSLALTGGAPAWADGYGEESRFPLAAALAAGEFKITEGTHAFGVDPTDNSVYVGEEAKEKKEEESGEYRIQKFSAGGTLLATTPTFNPRTPGAPGIDGIAVDPSEKRVYVLASLERGAEAKVDPSQRAAGTLYAFSTETLASAVAGSGKSETEGVLAGPEVLKARSEKAGEALLRPAGIAVDPKTHDVVLLGEVDTPSGRHTALERVSSSGTLRPEPYVAPAAVGEELEVNSPVVTTEGTVLAERNSIAHPEQILQIPGSKSTSEPAEVFHFNTTGTSIEELVEFNPSLEPPSRGGGLAFASEGSLKGTVYSDAEILEQKLVNGEVRNENGYPGVLALNLEDEGGKVTASERGWMGGRQPGTGATVKCSIAEETESYPLVAAGKEQRVFVLVPKTLEVVQFGPSGEGCPHTTVPAEPAIRATVKEQTVSEVTPGSEVKLSSLVVEGNALSVEWTFGDGTAPVTVSADEHQLTQVTHVFNAEGSLTITERIKSDDLATPEVVVQGKLKVSRTPTTLTTTLSGEGQSGASITVREGAAVSDKGTLAGANSAQAGGTVTYRVYSDEACSKEVLSAGSVSVSAGSVPASEAKTLAPGTYYWRASYNGDALDEPSLSGCGSEVEKVLAAGGGSSGGSSGTGTSATGTGSTGAAGSPAAGLGAVLPSFFSYRVALASSALIVSPSGALVITLECLGSSSCTGKVTLRTLTAVAAAGGTHRAVVTLAHGPFGLSSGHSKALTLRLSAIARRLLASVHVLRARAMIVARDDAGIAHNTVVAVTLRARRGGTRH